MVLRKLLNLHDENVIASAKRIFVDGDGVQVNIGVLPRSLIRRRAIVVPNRQFWKIGKVSKEFNQSCSGMRQALVLDDISIQTRFLFTILITVPPIIRLSSD